jgi:hypothetical protein
MIELLCFAPAVLASPFKSRLRLKAENAALRHQLMVLRRRLRGRVRITNHDRWFFVQLYRWFPSIPRSSPSSGPRRFRHRHEIARYRDGEWAERGEITLEEAAKIVGVCNMTALRMLRRGDIKGRQVCPGAPWVIKIADLTV